MRKTPLIVDGRWQPMPAKDGAHDIVVSRSPEHRLKIRHRSRRALCSLPAAVRGVRKCRQVTMLALGVVPIGWSR